MDEIRVDERETRMRRKGRERKDLEKHQQGEMVQEENKCIQIPAKRGMMIMETDRKK